MTPKTKRRLRWVEKELQSKASDGTVYFICSYRGIFRRLYIAGFEDLGARVQIGSVFKTKRQAIAACEKHFREMKKGTK